MKEFLFSGCILFFIFSHPIFSQTISSKHSSSTIEINIGGEMFGSKNAAALIGYNIKLNYYIRERLIGSLLYKSGVDFSDFGAVEPLEESEKLMNYLDEAGILIGYRLSEIPTGPYGRIGVSYLSGRKNNGQYVQTIGIPLEGGVNFQLCRFFSMGFVLTGNLNREISYWGFNLNAGIGL